MKERIEPEISDAEIEVFPIGFSVAELVTIHNALVAAPDGIFLKERLLCNQLRGLIELKREVTARRKKNVNR